MTVVTEKDIAIGIYEYLEQTTSGFDLAPSGKVDRISSERRIREYLKCSAPVLGRKKNWIFTNEVGEKVKFVKKGKMAHFKERYVDGGLYEYWIVELESSTQSIYSMLEWNDTSCCVVSCSALTLSNKELEDVSLR